MLTVDASVWVALLDRKDVHHQETFRFFKKLQRDDVAIFIPELALLEVACALARRARDARKGEEAGAALRKVPQLTIINCDTALLCQARQVGCLSFLRAADAVYAATAALTSTQLIAWDRELLERVGALSPAQWLEN